jgi:hypothetical protein
MSTRGHYERVGHTVNFGKPWMDRSPCEYGIISLPYLDGPELEGTGAKFLWLIPITHAEVEYKKKFGVEKLEDLFESSHFNFIDPCRASLCEETHDGS